MKKEYINCIHAFTAQCPHRTNEIMVNLLANPLSKEINITNEMIDNANSLCEQCTEFTSR